MVTVTMYSCAALEKKGTGGDAMGPREQEGGTDVGRDGQAGGMTKGGEEETRAKEILATDGGLRTVDAAR